MRISSLTIMCFGAIVIFASLLWFNKHPDTSQFVIYCGVGTLIMASGYYYNWMRNKDVNDEKLNNRIIELEKILFNDK